jgi:hypothetical protein
VIPNRSSRQLGMIMRAHQHCPLRFVIVSEIISLVTTSTNTPRKVL